jgi:hypothetical protein
LYGIKVLGVSGWPLYLPACRHDSPRDHFCTKVVLNGKFGPGFGQLFDANPSARTAIAA